MLRSGPLWSTCWWWCRLLGGRREYCQLWIISCVDLGDSLLCHLWYMCSFCSWLGVSYQIVWKGFKRHMRKLFFSKVQYGNLPSLKNIFLMPTSGRNQWRWWDDDWRFEVSNLYWTSNGWRYCVFKICNKGESQSGMLFGVRRDLILHIYKGYPKCDLGIGKLATISSFENKLMRQCGDA